MNEKKMQSLKVGYIKKKGCLGQFKGQFDQSNQGIQIKLFSCLYLTYLDSHTHIEVSR